MKVRFEKNCKVRVNLNKLVDDKDISPSFYLYQKNLNAEGLPFSWNIFSDYHIYILKLQ